MAKTKKSAPLRVQKKDSFFSSLSPLKQDLLCVAFLYVITLVLFRGVVFEDGTFATDRDTANAVTWAHVGDEIKDHEGVDVLWIPNFFSGMPTFGNVHYIPHDVSYMQKIAVTILKLFYLNGTWSWFPVHYFFAGLFTFLLLRVWKLSRIAALLGAITFMLSPYAIGLAAEGHGSKLMALSYLPLVFLLTHLLFERRDILSFGLLSAGIGTLLLTNHMQIVYYVLIVLGLYLLYHIARDFKQHKRLIPVKTLLFAGAVLIGLCISSYIYLSVNEYAQYSIRGGGTTGAKGGLTWEYATNWSFNPAEVLTLFIPSFFGFSSNYLYNWQGEVRGLPLYWGTMPFNTATVYFGMVPLFLAAVALIYKRNRKTIFFAFLSAVVLLLSFGKHFGILYELLFNTLPFFNKFRAPSIILHLLPFCFAVLGAFGLDYLLSGIGKEFNRDKFKKGLFYALGVIGVILILLLIMKSSFVEMFGFTFTKEGENYDPKIMAEFKRIRFDLLLKDYIKFFLITAATIGAIILYINNAIKSAAFSAIILGILLADLFIIDTKYIDPKPQTQLEQNFVPDPTINFLKEQQGLFRIFPVGDLYQETSFQYHGLQSVGGYSAAKLKIYQTMVDSSLYHGADPSFPLNMNVVNMLNVKYLVVPGQLPSEKFKLVYSDEARRLITYENPFFLPRAFFVNRAVVANSENEVFRTLNSADFNPATTAILEKEPRAKITAQGLTLEKNIIDIGIPDSTWNVSITDYKSREIKLKTKTSAAGLLVLGEIYYPAGWQAYVDGAETEIYKTNYILRSVIVPAGSHEIVFKFEPKLYALGYTLSNVAWGVAILCILIGLWQTPSVRARLHFARPAPSEQLVAAG